MLGGKLQTATLPNGEFFISFVTELELLSYPNLSKSEEMKIKDFLDSVDIIELSPEIKEETVRLRKNYKIKLPDAIICGTALFINASLLTFDRSFKKIKEITLFYAELN